MYISQKVSYKIYLRFTSWMVLSQLGHQIQPEKIKDIEWQIQNLREDIDLEGNYT